MESRVHDVVKHKQKAVSDAQVVFVPETQSTQPAVATMDSDGRYAMTTLRRPFDLWIVAHRWRFPFYL